MRLLALLMSLLQMAYVPERPGACRCSNAPRCALEHTSIAAFESRSFITHRATPETNRVRNNAIHALCNHCGHYTTPPAARPFIGGGTCHLRYYRADVRPARDTHNRSRALAHARRAHRGTYWGASGEHVTFSLVPQKARHSLPIIVRGRATRYKGNGK